MNQHALQRCIELQAAAAQFHFIAQNLLHDAYKTSYPEDTLQYFDEATYYQQRAARYAALARSILTD